ncbi:MAG: Uma2 family endonuclease [Candidatus Kapaibacteriota bacterium]|jgi:Uma2 family endonuclease
MPTVLEPSSVLAQAAPRLTVAEFRAMEFDDDDTFFYELLEGNIVRKSAPSASHQRVARNIFRALDVHVLANNLGEVLFAPIDVFLDDENVVQPDVLFIAAAEQHIVTTDGVQGAPNLIVEIINPSSMKRDRGGKMRVYEHCGVGEYWLVDIRTRSVEVYVNTDVGGRWDYDLREVFVADKLISTSPVVVNSFTIVDFTMPLETVFDGVQE